MRTAVMHSLAQQASWHRMRLDAQTWLLSDACLHIGAPAVAPGDSPLQPRLSNQSLLTEHRLRLSGPKVIFHHTKFAAQLLDGRSFVA